MKQVNKRDYETIPWKSMDIDEIVCATVKVSSESLALLKPYLKIQKVSKGEFVISEQVINRNMYFVKNGILRSFRKVGEKEDTLWFAVSGDTFCSMRSYFHDSPAVSNIEALSPCILYYIGHDDLENLFEQSHELANWGRLASMEMLDALEWNSSAMGSTDAYERYKAFLGTRVPEVIAQIPQKCIASYLGITPSTLSRIRLRYLKEK